MGLERLLELRKVVNGRFPVLAHGAGSRWVPVVRDDVAVGVAQRLVQVAWVEKVEVASQHEEPRGGRPLAEIHVSTEAINNLPDGGWWRCSCGPL